MAENLNPKTSSTQTQTFTKGLVKDRSDTYFPENSWSHAVNAVNYTFTGNVGTLSNEQSNYLCGQAPYDIIGKIRLFSGNWIIFSTNNTNSEIGWYNENNCKYCKIVNDPCLNFDQENLIVGESKKNFDCSYQIYWADGRNPDRAMNIGNPETWLCDTTEPWPGVPYLQECVDPEDTQTGIGCVECTNLQPLQLDCDKIRLSRLIDPVCVEIKNGQYGGNMPNGSYFVVVAYTINQQRVTDYSTPSNVQPIFQHDKLAGSLDITIKNIDKNTFEEFELVVVSIVNQQTVAKQVGYYSTNVTTITLDSIDITNPTVPIELIAVRSPIYEKSEQISQVNGYLLRLSPTTRFDFNYQPLANRIEAKWVAMEYPVDYYRKSGYRTSYLRDEVYSFWIRWVYETGEKTPSYHIPGRPPLENIDIHCPNSPDLISDFDLPPAGDDNIFSDDAYYEVYNTGFITEDYTAAPIPIGDGGQIVAKGRMGYWQSTETYPNKPEVWNSSAHSWSDYKCKKDLLYDTYADIDLCGEYIRHHKMPDNKCVPHIKSFASANSNGSNLYSDVEKIVLLGVEFDNINYPVDNDGKAIPGIIGYEILRSTREGNKSIIAKGMLNHMREYNINTSDDPMDLSYDNGLYQNYPYNYLGVDPTLTTVDRLVGEDCSPLPGLDRYSRNKFTFHSPDTQFREPFLAEKELKIYGEIFGDVTGNYDFVPGHPKHKVLTDFALLIAAFAGVGIAGLSIIGKRTINRSSAKAFNLGNINFGGPDPANPFDGVNFNSDIGTIVTPFGNLSQVITGGQYFNGVAATPEDNGSSQQTLSGNNQTTVDNTLTNNESNTITNIVSVLTNPDQYYTTAAGSFKTDAAGKKGYIGPGYDVYLDLTPYQLTTGLPGGLSSFANFLYYWTQGTDSVVKLIEAWIPYVQYALMYKSHGKYTQFDPGNFCISGNQRKLINDLFYIENTLQSYVGLDPAAVPQTTDYSINNLYRNKAVLIEVTTNVLDQNTLLSTTPQVGTCLYNPTELRDGTFGIVPDNTLQSLTTLNSNPIFQTIPGINSTWWTKPTREFTTQTRALYAAIKYRNRNQYGQLEPLRELPISDCVIKLPNVPASNTNLCKTPFVYESGLIYGGDIYIGRYTEKNKFFYFYDWLYEQLDGVGLDYTLKRMIQYPKYWGDFTGFDLGQFITNIGITFSFTPGASPVRILPNDFHNFDRNCSLGPFLPFIGGARSSIFNVNNAYFYLFNTGVRDFFVESEINVDLRDWGEAPEERHYDPYRYTDLDVLFDTSIIKEDNFYKYDYSLSIAKIYTNYVTWGETHPRYYDPNVSELCYQYYPNRLLYSLPFEFEQIRDNWYAFLANNYKDFPSKPNSVNSINKNGAIITFEAASPITFQGVDSQPLDAKLLTPEGWVTMGEITKDHKIIGRDGKTYNVLETYDIGDKPIYKIHFKDGSFVRASDTHKWNVLDYCSRRKSSSKYLEEKIKATTELVTTYHKRDSLPLPSPIDFSQKDFIISPYILGAMIADGCLTARTPFIACSDYEIIERIYRESNTISKLKSFIERSGTKMYKISLTTKGARRKDSNPFVEEFSRLGLSNMYSIDKFIPTEYLFGSIEQRLSLLRGLMDCDGSISSNKISYSTISKRLAEDLKQLIESLGGLASIKYYKKKGYTGKPIIEYRVRIQLDMNPFYLIRKQEKVKSRIKRLSRIITKVEYVGIEKARCIKTNAPDELYLTDNYTLTHNTLETELNTKITIGDGGLFSQPLQSIVNSDISYEYGSCQDKFSILSTPYGVFWISQNQGKVFNYSSGLNEISGLNMRWWFDKYLDYSILEDFPNFSLTDNPVAGVGCQTVYDNDDQIVYFCKRDFKLRTDLPEGTTVTYPGLGNSFLVNGSLRVDLGDPAYFTDASWTVSYDPKMQVWISFHDWHPNLLIPSKNNFISIKGNGIWQHNKRTDSYCNFYGKDYKFEVEYIETTGETVNTLRSLEYILENSIYDADGVDKYTLLDFNFDHCIIYNNEQVSGLLVLNPTPKNDVIGRLQYPIINPADIQILYDKVENKYRFNMFWDITDDRGEYFNPSIPGFAQRVIWDTAPDGYNRVLNPANLNYNKSALQRKKFRHYLNRIVLYREVSGNVNMIFKISNTKSLYSPR